jgi:predicted Zn-dependent peptidase
MVIKTKTLSNGFRVIHETPKTKTPISYVHLFCDVGSVHEPVGLRGVSHFIEHMCFKGTKKIPQSKDISLEFDNIGAKFNAHTEKRFTYFDVKCQDDYLLHCLTILSDMLMNSVFNRGEFKKEERVVMEETVRLSDNNTAILMNGVDAMLYEGTPYELPIDWSSYHKTPFVYKDVVDFYRLYYRPSRMILSIISHVEFHEIEQLLNKHDIKDDDEYKKN